MTTPEHLANLVGFKTISRDENQSLIAHIARHLSQHGGRTRILPGIFPGKANLIASFGPHIKYRVYFTMKASASPA